MTESAFDQVSATAANPLRDLFVSVRRHHLVLTIRQHQEILGYFVVISELSKRIHHQSNSIQNISVGSQI